MIDQNVAFATLVEQTADLFAKYYGRPPRWIAAAPGRVNVIGEHTDYNDGFVLPMAIERYTVLAADRPDSGPAEIQWRCAKFNESATFAAAGALQKGEPKWANYIKGVFAGFRKRGVETGPLRVLMNSTVPLGGGLSSSAALEVGTATLIEAVTGKTIDPVEKALLGQQAEHEFAGVPCGIMDQFISALGKEGHLLLLDCRTRKTELVPLADPGIAILIANTNVKHELTGGEYAQRRQQCEEAARLLGVPSLRDASNRILEDAQAKLSPVVFQRARHVIGEIERTVLAAQDIRRGDWPAAGQHMYASHASLRDDYEVSCKELDIMVEIARNIGPSGGVIGSRMTGGGFGGCTVSLVQAKDVNSIAAKMAAEYEKQTGIKPTLFVSRPAPGAQIAKQ